MSRLTPTYLYAVTNAERTFLSPHRPYPLMAIAEFRHTRRAPKDTDRRKPDASEWPVWFARGYRVVRWECWPGALLESVDGEESEECWEQIPQEQTTGTQAQGAEAI